MSPKLSSAVDRICAERWDDTLRIAAEEVFAMMVGAALTREDSQSDAKGPAGLTAMVGFAGALTGVLTIRCDRDSAAAMARKMLGQDSGASEQQWDAIGEICNMVAGNFKAKVEGLQDKCLISVPTVITGGDYQMHSLASGERFEVHMLFEGAPVVFTLEVTP